MEKEDVAGCMGCANDVMDSGDCCGVAHGLLDGMVGGFIGLVTVDQLTGVGLDQVLVEDVYAVDGVKALVVGRDGCSG